MVLVVEANPAEPEAMPRGHVVRVLATLLTMAVAILPASAFAQGTMAADRFVDSVGVNIHLHYDNTIYWNEFSLVRQRLIELGVRHVRDGLIDTTWRPYYDRHNDLGRAGIKGTFIMGVRDGVELLAQYPGRMGARSRRTRGPTSTTGPAIPTGPRR